MMRAQVRAYRREVSTISAAVTHLGLRLNKPEPGKMWNLVLRAPVYSFGSVLTPILPSRPLRTARWTASYFCWPRTASGTSCLALAGWTGEWDADMSEL